MKTSTREIHGYCTASGLTFSPQRAAQSMGQTFDRAIEVGDVLDAGRWKGTKKHAEEGYAALNFDLVPREAPAECRWESTVATIRAFVVACRDAGATDVGVVFLVGYVAQCNLELDSSRLRDLADLGVPVGLTCYVDADSGEPQ